MAEENSAPPEERATGEDERTGTEDMGPPQAKREVSAPTTRFLAVALGATFAVLATVVVIVLVRESGKENRFWYEGGTLQWATVEEWREGSERDRLASAGDWALGLVLRPAAEALVECVDEVVSTSTETETGVTMNLVAAGCWVLAQRSGHAGAP